MSTHPTLPIIIPVLNRTNLLKQTIESLAENTMTDFYPIVIDDASDAATAYYLKQLHQEGAIHLISNPATIGVGLCRNLGAAIAPFDHDYIYFSDSDMYFTPQWDQYLLKAIMAHPDIAILSGYQHPYHHPTKTRELTGYSSHQISITQQQGAASMLIKRQVWNKLGPFIGTPPGSIGGEDVMFCNKAKDLGYKVATISPSVVIHAGITRADGSKTAGAHLMSEDKRLYPEILFE